MEKEVISEWMLQHGDRIVFEKVVLKIPTHTGRTVDIRRIWNANIKVIPVKTGATGTISKHSHNT
jgi:hypothetical protein